MLGDLYLEYIAFLHTFDQLKPVPLCSLGWRKVPALKLVAVRRQASEARPEPAGTCLSVPSYSPKLFRSPGCGRRAPAGLG